RLAPPRSTPFPYTTLFRSLMQEAAAVRQLWGRHRPIWIAASTHAGEETQVLDAFARLRERFPGLLLVVVPRHPERFESVTRLCEDRKSTRLNSSHVKISYA